MSRAVRFETTGGPEVLQIVDVPEPRAGAGEVRVAVRAAGLNRFDTKVRTGSIPMPLPRGQGSEFAGVIDEVGDGVAHVSLGDEVMGWTSTGAQADHVVVDANKVAAKPAALDWPTAGGIGLVANTAARATAALSLRPGETVFISGVSGGVGMLAAQFARKAGAIVVGTASQDKHDFLRGLGVIPIAYGAGVLERLVAAAPDGYVAALDTVGRESIQLAISLGVSPERIDSIAYSAGGEEFGIMTVGGGKKTSVELAGFAHAAAEKELVLPILDTFPLARVRAAYELLETRHGLGKIVLTAP